MVSTITWITLFDIVEGQSFEILHYMTRICQIEELTRKLLLKAK